MTNLKNNSSPGKNDGSHHGEDEPQDASYSPSRPSPEVGSSFWDYINASGVSTPVSGCVLLFFLFWF
jgi:hypothetical protein